MPDGVKPFVQFLVSCWGKCTFISHFCSQVFKPVNDSFSNFTEKAYPPFQMEIIDIGSSDSDSDIEVELDEPFDGSSDSTTAQSRNSSERFRGQNHDMQVHIEQHHGSGFASYAAIRDMPFIGTFGENPGNTIEENGRYETCLLSSDKAIHASQPKDHAMQNSMSNENIDANLVSYVENIRDPEQQILTDMLPQANLESGSVTIGQNTDDRSSHNLKRTLPASLQQCKSGRVSLFNSRFHGKASFSPQKNPMQALKSKRPQGGPDEDADNNSWIDENLNQHVHKGNHLPDVQIKNASSRLADEQRSSQMAKMHKTTHGSVEANVSSSKVDVEEVGQMNEENYIYQKERRTLPIHWAGKSSNNSKLNASMHKTTHGSVEANVSSSKVDVEEVGQMNEENYIHQKERRTLPIHWAGKSSNNSKLNASLHGRVTGQNSNFSMKPSHPVLGNKADNTHMSPKLSLGNEKFITSSKGLYGGRVADDLFMYGNAPATRILPQYPGKSNSNPRLAGSTDGGQFPGIGEQYLEHDEIPIYQEALQNLGQPSLEDDLPEGLLSVSLLKHQKVALAWMVQKEKSVHCAGGILADDQGLGKTIAMIALILKQRDLQSKFTSDDSRHVKPEALNLDDDEGNNEMDVKCIGNGAHVKSEALNLHDDDEGNNAMNVKGIGKNNLQSKLTNTSENHRPAAGTLVVCPASVLRQWARELEEKVSSSTNLSVLVYHGGARTKDPKYLAKHDIILTTYSIVSNEVPKQPLVDDDDDNEQKDMEKYGLSSDFAAGKKRKQTSNVGKMRKKKGKGLRDSHLDYGGPLARVRWFRVILDEAQTIKNHRTQVARACSALRAKRRWCLSGTPMQNAIDDLYSYFRFLKYDPYAVYSSFCNSIKYPISRNASQGYKKLQAVLKVVLLRRTKATLINGEPIIKLPPKSICLKNVDFSPEERAFYLKLEADSRQQFKVYAAAGTVKQNYANILLMLLRLRQACDHPVLVKGHYFEANARNSLEMARQLPKEMLLNLLYQLEASAICPVCNDTPEDPVVTMCGHVFCYQCVSDRLTGDDNLCPATVCKDILGTDSVFSQATLKRCIYVDLDVNDASSSSVLSEESSIVQSGFVSSKICAAMDILNSLSSQSYHAGKTENSGDIWCSDKPVKAIVFSQWTRMLDLVEISLNRSLIQYRRLDGTMTLSSRDKSVREFNTDPEVTVMLMSLKAGNLGLNMVAACHVILLDLWWNPTTEDQAIDRAHRIGQTRPVTVSRLTIKETVEDRILALQEEKRKMVSSAFGEDHAGNHSARLTVEDLKYLFMI